MATAPQSAPRHVIVVGAGLVGLCCARTLQRDGHAVTLIDPDEPGHGASFGNAGILATGSVLPEATPGLWRRVPKMLLDPLSPLTIRPGYLPTLFPYFLRLMRNSTPRRVEALSQALAALVVPGLDCYRRLLDDTDVPDRLIRQNGCLYIYETAAALRAAREDNDMRRRRGIDIQLLGPEEIRQMVPALKTPIAGAMLAPASGQTLHPLGLSQALAGLINADGGRFVRERVTSFETGGGTASHVVTDAGRHAADEIVIAAGAFSRPLAKSIGSAVPLDTERGYHVMLPNPGVELQRPMLISAYGFAITPMAHGLRLAGTVEFAGLKAPPNYTRADVLLRHAKRLLPGLNDAGAERWMGFRPSLPDSLPVISRSPHLRNVSFAFGHGHLGVSLAAVTGRLIGDLIAGRPPIVDPAPYRVDRF